MLTLDQLHALSILVASSYDSEDAVKEKWPSTARRIAESRDVLREVLIDTGTWSRSSED